MLHITFFTEFPYTREILEHALLLNQIAEYVIKGSIGQLSLVMVDEDRFYASAILDDLAGLGLASRIRLRTVAEGEYDALPH